jgi:hypothetical protein
MAIVLGTDGNLFPESATKMVQAGKFITDIPTWAQNDGSMQTGPVHSEEDIVTSLKPWVHKITQESLSTIMELYPPEDFALDRERYEVHNPEAPKVSVH